MSHFFLCQKQWKAFAFSIIFSLTASLFLSPCLTISAQQAEHDSTISDSHKFQTDAPSALLMEASTGTILFEKDAGTQRPPASVTKIMTLLLIFDSISQGKIRLEDTVTVSEHAASMGGSQVFLEAGETQTVDTMIKCIAVASGNDAAVAMAEHIAGSEEAFVSKMNERAKELGMNHTHFMNCCGLDADDHTTTARDIALMSRELINRYPQITDYTTIWMENITHVTRRGSSEFGLTNTNKLIRQYEGATGLKTGSTSKAGFCLSATAERNGVTLIAVVMNCESSKARIAACTSLLDYGFSICRIYRDETPPKLSPIPVIGGTQQTISCQYASPFSCVTTTDLDKTKISTRIKHKQSLYAPVKKGQEIGTLVYYYEGHRLGSVPIIAASSIAKAGYKDYLFRLICSL